MIIKLLCCSYKIIIGPALNERAAHTWQLFPFISAQKQFRKLVVPFAWKYRFQVTNVYVYKYQLCNKDLTKRLSLAPSVIFVIKANNATSLLAY